MDISKVAKESGLPASTLRFYEQKGLIKSIGRSGLKRTFSSKIIERLALISLGRSAGLSLDEIAEMLTSTGLKMDRELLLSKADELDKQIKKLMDMRNGLRHAAACKADTHLECPKFLRLLNIAAKNKHRKQNKL